MYAEEHKYLKNQNEKVLVHPFEFIWILCKNKYEEGWDVGIAIGQCRDHYRKTSNGNGTEENRQTQTRMELIIDTQR